MQLYSLHYRIAYISRCFLVGTMMASAAYYPDCAFYLAPNS